MKLLDSIRLALQQIRVQKLKSFFTLLGVMIGVMFLVAVVSIVTGMGRYMEEDFVGKLMGVNTFELRRFPSINIGNVTDAEWKEWMRRPYLRDEDVHPVVDGLPAGTRWATRNAAWAQYIESEYARRKQAQLFAVNGDFFNVQNITVGKGRVIAEQELQHGALVAVIGADVASHFFPNLDPIGRTVRIGGIGYTVIGVADPQGSIFGHSLDKFVVVPLKSPARRLTQPPGVIATLLIKSSSVAQMKDVMDQVRATMRERRRLRPSQPDNFVLFTSESALDFWTKVKAVMTIAGAAIPGIGLIVGAMVIMNIMLVAVAERTREIGVRKALGARRRDIRRQFLAESATLSTVGAAIGVALGIAFAGLVTLVSPLPMSVAPWSVALGVALGTITGVVAGVYPAVRAARLDPITAIRQE
ncbi:MAG TPA: ABC transporter permease [Gemmatimonadaceae bacterium]|nr:ABC transporter permease [Gemmatimonadaceae bacterium]